MMPGITPVELPLFDTISTTLYRVVLWQVSYHRGVAQAVRKLTLIKNLNR